MTDPTVSAFPQVDPVAVLRAGADSFAAYLQPSGELHDPVVDAPTQYGTAYYAYLNAVLAERLPAPLAERYAERAARGLSAALAHTADPDRAPTASGLGGPTGGVRSAGNHRDFTWPPILRTFLLLRASGVDTGTAEERIRSVDLARSFHSRPPSNWASVWLSGEWLRIRAGLSPYDRDEVDGWLEPFFDRLDLDLGWYEEPGRPNSYDLFTRFHLADLLAEGYDGAAADRLRTLVHSGVRRSLAVQLSDGALASAHRSTGQAWTDGAQVAYFATVAPMLTEPTVRAEVDRAALRALGSLARWQRPGGPFSPVYNRLPASFRIGYEGYTADAHYVSLALAFLATAVRRGLPTPAGQPPRPLTVRVEQRPTYRAVAHHGPVSVAVNGDPAPAYDAYGLTDLTFGPGRWLALSSSVRHLASGALLNVGLGLRAGPGRLAVDALSSRPHQLDSLTAEAATLRLTGTALATESAPARRHELDVTVRPDGVRITEGTPGHRGHHTVLVPYLLDYGGDSVTEVVAGADGVELRLAGEVIVVRVEAAVESWLDLRYGYDNRRGRCGLLRIDLAATAETTTFELLRAR